MGQMETDWGRTAKVTITLEALWRLARWKGLVKGENNVMEQRHRDSGGGWRMEDE